MLTVKTCGLFDGQFTRFWKQLFVQFSSKPFSVEIKAPLALKTYLDLLGDCLNSDFILKRQENLRRYNKNDYDEEKVLVGFSGGKDSLACVLKLMDDGYEPILFYVDGINRSYTNEVDYARELARELNLEIYIYKISIYGKCDFIENPIKNQFILALMVDYGVKLNINKYAFGTVWTDEMESISSEYMLSDCYELLKATEKFYQEYIKYFELLIPLKNETESFCVIDKFDYNTLLDNCFSCMTPLRYKKGIRAKNEQKYGIKLRPNRCGSCYKCCQEAVILNEMGVEKYSALFIQHCNEIIDKFQDKLDATANGIDDKPWIDLDMIKLYKGGEV